MTVIARATAAIHAQDKTELTQANRRAAQIAETVQEQAGEEEEDALAKVHHDV